MNKYCLICSPRSGSFYVERYIGKTFNLEIGKEWFGRVKKVHYKKLKTSAVDIDHSVNENLLSKKEISKRLIYLKNYGKPFIIKCMPFQLTNTIEDNKLSYEEKQEISTKYMNNFSLIYLETRDKISQFCFDVISKNQNHVKRNFTSYTISVREVPEENSMTATEEHFDSFMVRQNFVKDFKERNWKGEPIIYYEDFVEDHDREMKILEGHYFKGGDYKEKNKKQIIKHEDYKKIFKNFSEVEKWFSEEPK